jgi:hypothetical protein
MNGTCLCGAVHLTVAQVSEIGACHCGFCRKWGGGPMLGAHCGTEVTFTGEAHITVYASSEWAERAFCRRCGTHLYYKLLPTGEYFVPAGVLDSEALALTSQIYIDKKPPYYTLANETVMLTEQQVLAQYGMGGDGPSN